RKLMVAEILGIMGFILFYALFCPMCWVLGVIGMVAIVLGFLAFLWWAFGIPILGVPGCSPSKCNILNELMMCFIIIDLLVAILNIGLIFIGTPFCPLLWWRAVHAFIVSFFTFLIWSGLKANNC